MKHIKTIGSLLALVLMISGCAKNDEKITGSSTLLNTVVSIDIYNYSDENILNDAFTEIDRLEKLLSVDYEGSDLYRLYANSSEFVSVEPETYFVLEESARYSEMSEGAFDVTVGPLVSCWNIKEGTGRVPPEGEIDEALELVNFKEIELLDGKYAKLNRKGMKVHLGAIAKGYIADKTKELLVSKNVDSAVINLGGNILLIGEKPNNQPFNIGIHDPKGQQGKYLGFVPISDKSLVSSGSYERFFELDGVRYHHILDVKTGFPTNNELLQTTIIAEKSIDCDALSTTTFLLGLEKGMKLIEQLPDVEAIFVTKDNEIFISSGVIGLTVTNDEYRLQKFSY